LFGRPCEYGSRKRDLECRANFVTIENLDRNDPAIDHIDVEVTVDYVESDGLVPGPPTRLRKRSSVEGGTEVISAA